MRVIGTTANVIHSDFSSDGKTSGIDWAKVWDPTIPEGKVVGNVKQARFCLIHPLRPFFNGLERSKQPLMERILKFQAI